VTRSSPSISVIIAGSQSATGLPLADASEVIVVDSSVRTFVAGAGTKVRHVHSTAPAGQRTNIGISFASGDWVVALDGTERLARNWIGELASVVTNGNECVHCITPKDASLPLVAVWRPAFAYGALDGRIDHAPQAVLQWVFDIFPHHRHRVLTREGVQQHAAAWLQQGARPLEQRACFAKVPATATQAYDPQKFWEEGGKGWVKWEAYQPDEPEIMELVERTAPQRVVELGCGGGRNARYFAGAERYAGLDISMPLLERARDRQEANCIGLLCGDAVRLPFADKSFDLVFAVSTIQHVQPEHIATCVAEIARVSRRHIALIEFTQELPCSGNWFKQPHMFQHDYATLMAPHAELQRRRPTGLQIQPAVKEMFLFEKRERSWNA